MSTLLFENNATSTLAGSLGAGTTVIPVATGTGDLFPSPGAGEYFVVSLFDQANPVITEICWCTSRTGDSLTVVRARETTSALTWSVGDIINNDLTAGQMASLVQRGEYSYAADTGAADVYAITPAPALTAYAAGVSFQIKFANANTGPSTLNVSSLGTKAIQFNGAALAAGVITAGLIYTLTYDGTQFQIISQTSQASTARKGIAALADNTATQAGASTTTVLTPAGLFSFPSGGTPGTDLYFEIPGTELVVQMGTYTSLTTTQAGAEDFTFPVEFANPSRPFVQLTAHSTSGTTDNLTPAPPNGTFTVHHIALAQLTPPTFQGFSFWCGAESETTDVFNGKITTFEWFAIGPRA